MAFTEHEWRRIPVTFLNGVASSPAGEVAHAVSDTSTLCGLSLGRVSLISGFFDPGGESACTQCSERAAATRPERSTQERLYDEVVGAEPGPLRDELIDALKAGAKVHPWVIDPSADRIRSRARLHEAIEGGAEADSALQTEGPVALAEVVTSSWRFVAIMPEGSRPVIVRRPPRRRAGPERLGWSFEQAREPAQFAAGLASGRTGAGHDTEHAMDGDTTLCGIAAAQVVVVRHLYRPDHPSACPDCAEQAAAAPSQPCAQERLHDAIAAADPGPLRDGLAAALRHGAEITLWITGPGPSLAEHHAQLDQITDGSDTLTEALLNGERVDLAHVLHGPWRSTVVLREGERPLIGRGPT